MKLSTMAMDVVCSRLAARVSIVRAIQVGKIDQHCNPFEPVLRVNYVIRAFLHVTFDPFGSLHFSLCHISHTMY